MLISNIQEDIKNIKYVPSCKVLLSDFLILYYSQCKVQSFNHIKIYKVVNEITLRLSECLKSWIQNITTSGLETLLHDVKKHTQ